MEFKDGRHLLLELSRIPYSFALLVLNRQLDYFGGSSSPSLWPRNSFLTPAFRPFKSDLDVTIWFEKKPNPKIWQDLRKSLKRTKTLFPILGESNIYVRDFAREMSGFINRYELARDPELEATLKKSRRVVKRPTTMRAEKFVFLLRMLEADLRNLLNSPRARRLKWKIHFEAVGLSVELVDSIWKSGNPVAGILQAAFGFFDSEPSAFRKKTCAEIEAYLRERARGVRDGQVKLTPCLLAVFPQRFCFIRKTGKLVNPSFREIASAQVAWEIWGISSQFPLLIEDGNMLTHLASLKRVLEKFGSQASFKELVIGVDKVSLAVKNRNKTSAFKRASSLKSNS